MYTIALFENDPAMLETLVEIINQEHEDMNILQARTGSAALYLLALRHIDLVICEQTLPDMEEMEILTVLADQFPDIPSIALVDSGEKDGKQALESGASKFHEKPVTAKKLLKQIGDLLRLGGYDERLEDEQDGGSNDLTADDYDSKITGLALHSFLQMLESEEKTCTLRICSTNKIGLLYLQDGQLMAAETGKLRKEEAVYEMICWDNPSIEIKYSNPRKEQEITKPLMSILMESFRLKDEREARKKPDSLRKKARKLKRMSTLGRRISLDIGAKLTMGLEGIKSPMESIMVGMIPDKLLIVTTPSHLMVIEHKVTPGTKFLVKFLNTGNLYFFKSQLICAVDEPQKLLFLSYPPLIHYQELRNSKRAVTFILCTIFCGEGRIYHGAIIDLSRTGALCQVKSTEPEPFPRIQIDDMITVRCLLPNVKEEIDFSAQVKNMRKNRYDAKIGVEFKIEDQKLQHLLDEYLASVEPIDAP